MAKFVHIYVTSIVVCAFDDGSRDAPCERSVRNGSTVLVNRICRGVLKGGKDQLVTQRDHRERVLAKVVSA